MHDLNYYKQIADPLERLKELIKDIDNSDFETCLSSEEFSTGVHEAIDDYDAKCREAEKEYNEKFRSLCG